MKAITKVPKIRFPGFTEDWEQHKFSDIAKTRRGLTYKPNNITERGIRVLRSSNIDEDIFVFGKEDVFVEKSAVNIPYVQNGDILITSANGSSRLVGKHTIIKNLPEDSAVHGGFMLIASSKNSNFLNASMSSEWYRKFINIYVAGGNGAIGNLNKNDLDQHTILLPCEEEQKKIGDYFFNIDNLITIHQRKCDEYKKLKKAMLQKMFPKKGEKIPEVRFAGFKEPWKQCSFGDIFTERHTLSKITSEYPQLSFTIAEGVILPEDRKTNKRDFLIKDIVNKKYLMTEYNDIIYNPANIIHGAIHRNSLGPGCVSPIYKIFICNENPSFMECVVKRDSFINEISRKLEGTVKKLKTLKPEAFLEMETYIPPTLEEQEKIANYFESLNKLIVLHQCKCDDYKELKKGLLQQMFV